MLPTIETPKYYLTVPSTGESIEYRPFLVKEEKVLLIAQESGAQASMIAAMKDVIRACTFNKIDLYTLAMYDLEYILLQIRARSVGETAKLKIKCDDCDEYVPVEINLIEVEVQQGEEAVNTVQLTDSVGVTLKAPGLKDIERSAKSKNSNEITSALGSVIESVYDSDNVYPLDQATPKEVDDFIDSLSSQQVVKIQKWVDSIPKLEKEITFTCSKGHTTTKVLSGLSDFFE